MESLFYTFNTAFIQQKTTNNSISERYNSPFNDFNYYNGHKCQKRGIMVLFLKHRFYRLKKVKTRGKSLSVLKFDWRECEEKRY